MPRLSASDRRISTSAAPPSEMELELAAVTVPPSRKAGLRPGILSGFAFSGCSSTATTVSPWRVFTVTGSISAAKVPSSIAVFARLRDSMANASWASRVNW